MDIAIMPLEEKNMHATRTLVEQGLIEQFKTLEYKTLPALRAHAFDIFEAQGLPSRRLESWHYTDLRAKMQVLAPHVASQFPPPSSTPLPHPTEHLDGFHLYRENGQGHIPQVDVPAGLSIWTLSSLPPQYANIVSHIGEVSPTAAQDPAVALHLALMQEPLILHVAGGVHLKTPVILHELTSGPHALSTYPHLLMIVEEGAQLTLLTHVRSDAHPHQIQAMTEIWCERDAHCTHLVLDQNDQAAQTLLTTAYRLQDRAHIKNIQIAMGSSLARHQIFAHVEGECTEVTLHGLSLARDHQHLDHTLVVEHMKPHGTSRETYKHILEDHSSVVFQGKVCVAPAAQKTDGAMASHALLLSDEASMSHKPELEIFADDVLCAHGATCGDLDVDQLFYLQARGLSRPQAEAVLLEAFAVEILEGLSLPKVQECLYDQICIWLKARETFPSL